jgi:hypothetical protein
MIIFSNFYSLFYIEFILFYPFFIFLESRFLNICSAFKSSMPFFYSRSPLLSLPYLFLIFYQNCVPDTFLAANQIFFCFEGANYSN